MKPLFIALIAIALVSGAVAYIQPILQTPYDQLDTTIAKHAKTYTIKTSPAILSTLNNDQTAHVIILLKPSKFTKFTTAINSITSSEDKIHTRTTYVSSHVASLLKSLRDTSSTAATTSSESVWIENPKPFGIIDGFIADVSKTGYADLNNHPEVLGVFPDYTIKIIEPVSTLDESRTAFNIANPTVSATYTRDVLNLTGKGVRVAVIDTGIDYTHITLGNCTQTQFLGGNCTKVVNGTDFCGNTSNACGGGADNDPIDDNGHGTHVASIIGGNNASGFIGIAPNVTFLAIKSFSNTGSGLTSGIIQGIDYAIAQRANIIQASFGSSVTPDDGFDATGIVSTAAVEAFGITFVASASNTGPDTESMASPAVARGILSVAASDDSNTLDVSDDTIASFSSRGPMAFGRFGPTVTAPGTSINASAPPTSRCPNNPSGLCSNALFNPASGTSFSSPIVTGVIAQLLESKPNITAAEIKLIISGSAQNMSGHPFEKGAGIINATAAIQFLTRAAINTKENTAIEAVPGGYQDLNITIFNLDNTSDHTYSFGIETISDIEGDHSITTSNVDIPRIQTLTAGANNTYTARFKIPTSTPPGIYGTTIIITSNTGENLRLPVALTIPFVGEGRFDGTLNDPFSTSAPGDNILYKLLAPNGTQLNIFARWASTGDDLDLILFTEGGIQIATAGAGNTDNETINFSVSTERAYWLLINDFGSPARIGYNITITYNSNLSISPQTRQISLLNTSTTNTTFTLKNGASAKTNVTITITRLQESTSVITTVNTTGNASFDRTTFDSAGVNTTRIKTCNMIANWTSTALHIDLGYFGRTSGTDVIQRYESQHSTQVLNDTRQFLTGVDVSYLNTNYSSFGFYVQNNNATTTPVTVNITCSNYHPAAEGSINHSFIPTIPADANIHLLVSINGSGTSPGSIRDYLMYIQSGNKTFAEIPIKAIFTRAVSATNYSGNTTAFENISDVTDITNLTLQIPTQGQLRWGNRVNALSTNFDTAVTIGNRFISVNDSALATSFNTSAIATIEGIRCDRFLNIRTSATYTTTINTIFASNAVCNATTNPSCTNITCSNSILSFTPNHFSSYAPNELNLTAQTTPNTTLGSQNIIINGTFLSANASPLNNAVIFMLLNGTLTNTTTNTQGFYNQTRIAPITNGTFFIILNTTIGNVTINLTLPLTVNLAAPSVTNLSPTAGLATTQNSAVRISTNVTSTITIDTVFANITLPNNTVRRLTLIATGDIYNGSFTETGTTGTYIFSIVANDTQQNINNTVNSSFVINDVTRPTVENLSSTPIIGNQSNTYNISAAISDNVALDTIIYNVSNSTHVVIQQLIGTNSGNTKFSAVFNTTSTTSPGNYTYKAIVNDSSNNLNNTLNSSFVINDITPPRVENLSSTPTIGNQSNTYNLSVAASDNIIIDSVMINVSNSTNVVVSQLLGTASGNGRFSAIFNTTSSTSPGTYTYRIIANDTSNNLNSTNTNTFTLSDITNPSTFAPISNPIIGNQSNTINITFNSSDNFLLDIVQVNITLQDASIQTLTTSINTPGQRSAIFTTTSSTAPGNYTYRLIANDTTGNRNNTITSTFIINDITNPSVVNLSPTTGTTLAQTIFRIAANATDNHAVHTVRANITGTAETLIELFNTSNQSNIWNASTSLTTTGEYNITIIANDTGNNINTTTRVTVVVTDQSAPNLSLPTSTPTLGNQSTTYNISALAVDPFVNALANVYTNITAPNNSFIIRLNMTNSGANRFSAIFNTTTSTLPGNYTYIIIANDSTGNTNITSSALVVNDVSAPSVTELRSNPIIGNQSNTYNISANITDNTNSTSVGIVSVNITAPGGSITELIMTRQGTTPTYSANHNTTLSSPGGNHTYRIIALDIFGNANITQTSSFIVNDGANPSVVNLSSNIIIGNQSNTINISATAIDNGAVDAVLFNVSNSSNIVVSTLTGTISATNRFSALFISAATQSPGNYTYRVIANDTAGNRNDTITSSFVINDITPPRVENLSSTPTTGNQSNTYNISAAASDATLLDTVLFNVSNSTNTVIQTLIGTVTGNGRFAAIFNTTSAQSIGNYTYRIITNDSVNNINNTINSSFVINDITQPNVIDLRVNPTIGNQTNNFNLTLNATDNFILDTTLINVTNPIGAVLITLRALQSASGEFSAIFNTTSTTAPGNYSYRVITNDTSANTNSTQTKVFVINDITAPTLTNPQPSTATTFFANDSVTISINATDSTSVARGHTRITRPDGITHTLNLANNTKDIFSTSFSFTNITGQYNVSILINDTWNNTANQSTFFIIQAGGVSLIKTILTENPTNITRTITYRINITNTGQLNFTNISIRDTYETGFLNFTTSSITIDNSSNLDGTLIIPEILDGNHGFGVNLANGSSILINISFRALRNTTNTSNTINVTLRDTSTNITSIRRTTPVEIRVIPITFTGFVNSTNYSGVDDITNISNATLGNNNGTIRWVSNIDGNGLNFDTAVRIITNATIVNTTALNPTTNTTAIIQLLSITCPITRISFTDNTSTDLTAAQIQSQGRDCTGFGICSNLSCNNNILSFTTAHFSGFAAGTNANLTTAATGNSAGAAVNFTALYINVTNNATILGASCNLSMTGLSTSMSNSTTGYNVTTTSLLSAGTFEYNITCAGTGFTTLVANDTVTITAAAAATQPSGGGGGGSSRNRVTTTQIPTQILTQIVSTPPLNITTSFDLIEIIKDYYKGNKKHTAFEILDLIKAYYHKV